MGSAELIETEHDGLYVIGDPTDLLQVESNIYSAFPSPKPEKHVETMRAKPADELLVRKPAKAAIKRSGLKFVDLEEKGL
jgi:hypothetical protein